MSKMSRLEQLAQKLFELSDRLYNVAKDLEDMAWMESVKKLGKREDGEEKEIR